MWTDGVALQLINVAGCCASSARPPGGEWARPGGRYRALWRRRVVGTRAVVEVFSSVAPRRSTDTTGCGSAVTCPGPVFRLSESWPAVGDMRTPPKLRL